MRPRERRNTSLSAWWENRRLLWSGGSRFRKAPSSASGEGQDDDREQEQETEREACDCEEAVCVNAVNEHGLPPGLPKWVAAGAVR